jgi:hypothetical protein
MSKAGPAKDPLQEMRRQIADLQEGLQALQMEVQALKAAIKPKKARPLHKTVRDAILYVTAYPGQTGHTIAAAIGKDPAHFRRTIAPQMEKIGFRTARGGGIYPPPAETGSVKACASVAPHTLPRAG